MNVYSPSLKVRAQNSAGLSTAWSDELELFSGMYAYGHSCCAHGI